MRDRPTSSRTTPWPALALVTVVVGVTSGLGGTSLALVLRITQHLAYGYDIGALPGHESFLQGVTASTPLRRVLALSLCGLLAGAGWWAIHRFCRPVPSVNEAIARDDPRMPLLATTADAILQIVTVGLGSPLGREVAPRQIGAMLAGLVSRRSGLTVNESRRMVACGAGAGLAAVYNVPFGGAVFILETLLGEITLVTVFAAFGTSLLAALVARRVLGNEPQYRVPPYAVRPVLVAWSLVGGPIFGLAAHLFHRLVSAARAHAPRDRRLLLWCPVTFVAIGLVATSFPQILGNGRIAAQLGFEGALAPGLPIEVLVLKALAVAAALRAGAMGGVLTPSVALGALLAIVTGDVVALASPGAPPGGFAVVGAAAFLASSQRMPLTAIVLLLEFTRASAALAIPMALAVGGSVAASKLCARKEPK